MPAYLVELADNEKTHLVGNKLGKLVVFAGSGADAKAVAKSSAQGDSSAAWANATVTDLSTAQNFSGMAARIQVLDNVPVIDVTVPMPSGNVVASGTIDTAGSGYSVNDILTVATGTKVRAATFRVTSESGGAVDGIELVDPGDSYSVDPTLDGVATTGGSGTGCELDLVMVANDLKNIMGAAVTALNANADIAGAAIDYGAAGAPLLTIAAISDGIGDKKVAMKMYIVADPGQEAIPGLVGAIVDEGIAAAVLTAALPTTPVAGAVLAVL